MKMISLLFFAFVLLCSGTPLKIKPQQRIDYENYRADCERLSTQHMVVTGKVKLLKKNGYYTDPQGDVVLSKIAPTWYAVTTHKFTFSENEKQISKIETTVVQKLTVTKVGFEAYQKAKRDRIKRWNEFKLKNGIK